MHYTLALALGSSFTIVALISTGLVGITIYFASSHFLRAELAHRLSHTSRIALLNIDAEQHELLQDLEDEETDYYKELREKLQLVQAQSDDVPYVYTVRMVKEGEKIWVRDDEGNLRSRPAKAGGDVVFVMDADPDDVVHIREVYEDAPELLRQALLGAAEPNSYGAYVPEDFYTDQWGTFLSGYIPIRDKEGNIQALLGTDISAAAVLAHEREYKLIVVALCALVALVTIPIGLKFAGWIRSPLRAVNKEMDRIEKLDLDHEETITSRIIEVDQMGRELDNMKNGLRSFRKYVPARLVRQLMELGVEAKLGGTKEEVSIFFSDIAGFSSVSEHLPPEQLVDFLGEYLSTVTETLLDCNATVDKYIGDAVMAFWNAPVRQSDHAYLACKATLACKTRIDALNQRWEKEGRGVVFKTRIGIHTGEAIVGNMGSEQRLSYTIMGDNVNLASRLEGANKAYGTEVLISGATYEQVRDRIVARRIDRVAVKGKTVPVDFYELVGVKEDVDLATSERVARYESGFDLYVSRQFSEAARVFREVLDLDPKDAPAETLRKRCLEYENNPPPEDWDGNHILTEK